MNNKKIGVDGHTHAFEFLLEISHMVALGDVKVEIRILGLEHLVGRVGSSNCEDGGGSIGSLGVSDFLNQGHSVFLLGIWFN